MVYLIINKDYDLIYSSRKVIKNQYINTQQKDGYYSYDLWKDIADKLAPVIPNSYTLYGEAIGYVPNRKIIQKTLGVKEKNINFVHKIFKTEKYEQDVLRLQSQEKGQ